MIKYVNPLSKISIYIYGYKLEKLSISTTYMNRQKNFKITCIHLRASGIYYEYDISFVKKFKKIF